MAGPPFTTDDPEPVEFQHWEFYMASEQQFSSSEVDATLPHIEINYGAAHGVQLHLVFPMGYSRIQGGDMHYGYGNTEFGVKYRFLEETSTAPQVGIFPLVEIPTGSKEKDLGTGNLQAFLPVWFQKGWGKFTTYGGGGFWYNPGDGQKNWGLAGWEFQYDFSSVLTLGGELTYHTPAADGDSPGTALGVGGYINFDEKNHLLFAFGHALHGEGVSNGYIGYQLTI